MTNEKKVAKIRWLDFIFVLRPMLFYPGWSTLLAGFFIAYKNKIYDPHISYHQIQYDVLVPVLVAFACAMGASFVLNQLADIKTDLANNKLFIISNGIISKPIAYIYAIFLAIAGLVTGLLINFHVFIFLLIFIVLTGYLYNFHPFKFKDKQWQSVLANSLMGWLAFAIGWGSVNELDISIFMDSLPYLFFNTSLYFFTILPDIEGDRSAHKMTFAVRYGINRIIYIALVLYIAGFLTIYPLRDMQAFIFYLLSLPFFVLVLIKRDVQSTIRATKFAILFFALSICLKWPVYFFIMLIGYLATRYYFRYRFNFDYPNFSGD